MSGHMSRTTDGPKVFLDSSNYTGPTGSYSPFLSLTANVAGPSSSSSSSSTFLLPQLKANPGRCYMAHPATKAGPVPMQAFTYVPTANPIAQLPYALYPAHAHTTTPAYYASSWAVPQPVVALPRGGAPARPQRLHANRMQPFPSRVKAAAAAAAGAVPSERQDRKREGGIRHFQTAPTQPGLVFAPTFPVGVQPVHGKGPPVLHHAPRSLFVVPTVRPLFVPPQLPILNPIPFCLPQPPLLTAPSRVTYLHHAGVSFIVSHLLGEGSAGRVVLGQSAGRPYAIKVIHPRRAKKTHSLRSNFLREMAFMLRVGRDERTSRFFVRLLMSWEEDGCGNQGRIFFVMVRLASLRARAGSD